MRRRQAWRTSYLRMVDERAELPVVRLRNVERKGVPDMRSERTERPMTAEQVEKCECCGERLGRLNQTYTTLDGVDLCRRCYEAVPSDKQRPPYHERSNRREWFLVSHPNEVIEAYSEDGSLHESVSREIESLQAALQRALSLARHATNGWACYAKRKPELDEIGRLHRELDAMEPSPAADAVARSDGDGQDGPRAPSSDALSSSGTPPEGAQKVRAVVELLESLPADYDWNADPHYLTLLQGAMNKLAAPSSSSIPAEPNK